MNQEQKKIILDEIKSWRNNKLLPAEYCDFLMNLYAEGESFSGEQKESAGTKSSGASKSFRPPFGRIVLILGFLLLFLIFVFNFTMFPMPMQIALLIFGISLAYFFAFRVRSEGSPWRMIWLSIASLLVVLSGYFYLLSTDQLGNREAVISCMSLVFLIWVLTGWIGRSRIIAGCGWAGLLLLFATILETTGQVGNSSYGMAHLYWLVPAIFSLVLAFMFGRGGVYIAPVFLLFGMVALFGPDLRMLVYNVSMDFLVQAIVFIKLSVLVSLLIVFRLDMKKWAGELSV